MRGRVAGLAIGLIFGVTLSWSGMTSPDVIRAALLFEQSYLFLFFAAAVLTATSGTWLLRRIGFRALFTGQRVTWTQDRPARRHIVGSLIFGLGWGIADACPGPIATQVGQGIAWALWTLGGVIIGVVLFLRRQEPETEPATDTLPATAAEPAHVRA
ncbi:MAG TPA: DUF6691 family protein [Solirubrobacteraceae bacterium]|jgi:hypothetical protein